MNNTSVYFLINLTKTLKIPSTELATVLSLTLLSTDFVSNAPPFRYKRLAGVHDKAVNVEPQCFTVCTVNAQIIVQLAN